MDIIERFLPRNVFSRPGVPMDAVKGVVIHYPEVAGQRAETMINYWATLATQDAADKIPDRSASAHGVIDLDGTPYMALPLNEKAYHVGATVYSVKAQALWPSYCTPKSSPNRILVGLELCHPAANGKPTEATEATAIWWTARILSKFGLSADTALFRHYDITGKLCHKWYVLNEPAWKLFKIRVKEEMCRIGNS